MPPRTLPLLLAVALATGACDDAPEAPDPGLDAPTAAVLAYGAERAASAIDRDEPCRALAELDELRDRSEDGLVAGEVPRDVAVEVERVVLLLSRDLSCEEDDADGEADRDADDPVADDQQAEEDPTTTPAEGTAPAPTPAPAPSPASTPDEAPEPDHAEERDDERGPGDRGQADPRGEARGHDR